MTIVKQSKRKPHIGLYPLTDRPHLRGQASGSPGAEKGAPTPSGDKDWAVTPGELSFLQNCVSHVSQVKGVPHLVEKVAVLKCLQKSLDQEYNTV